MRRPKESFQNFFPSWIGHLEDGRYVAGIAVNLGSQEPLLQGFERSGKLQKKFAEGQASGRRTRCVISHIYQLDSLFADRFVNGMGCARLLHTGFTTIIIKKGTAEEDMQPTRFLLKTVTGKLANTYGEMDINIGIGRKKICHRVIVVDIIEEVIIGMDVMKNF